MNQSTVAYISKFSFFARACALLKATRLWATVFGFVFVGGVCSTGLIHAENSKKNSTLTVPAKPKTNEALERRKANRELLLKNTSEGEKALIEALRNDPSGVVRQSAAQQLGNHSQNPLVVRALAEALRDDREQSVRYASALSLGLSPTFKAITALEKAASDPDPDLRRQVAFSLKRHRVGQNKRKATDLLKKLQRDTDPSVRAMAAESLR